MGFTLDIPKKEEIQKVVEEQTQVDVETALAISDASKEKGAEIMNTNLDNFEERKEITKAIEEFGTDIIEKSSTKNALMKTRLGDLSRAGGESGVVAKGLEDLSVQMKDLDPSGIDFMKTGPLGKPVFSQKKYPHKP